MTTKSEPTTSGQMVDPIVGRTLVFGRRKAIIEACNDNGTLRLVPPTGGEPLLVDTDHGQRAPDREWLREQYARGAVRVMDMPSDPATIAAFGDLFDPLATLEGRVRERALWNLAQRALADGLPRTEPKIESWLDSDFGIGPYDTDIDKPSAPTLRRAMTKVKKGATIADLANRAGRRKGGTPFPSSTDALIHQGAVEYWTNRPWKKWRAYERLKFLVDDANRKLPTGAEPHTLIGRSAFYVRIDRLECWETVAAKFSEGEADRRFGGAGEPVKANFCFELGYIDASRLENVIVFDENRRLPFVKPWITSIMDVKSGAILACHVHAGDPRVETTLQTLLMSLRPRPDREIENFYHS